MEIEQITPLSFDHLIPLWFGGKPHNHPGVSKLLNRGNFLIGGKVYLFDANNGDSIMPNHITANHARLLFENMGWQKIIAWHSADLPIFEDHKLQKSALESSGGDGIFIHPMVKGMCLDNKNQYSECIIIDKYRQFIKSHYQPEKAFLSGFAYIPRYSGSRETVFHALCRKNFGCSHFFVGNGNKEIDNNHQKELERIFKQMGDIGIKTVFSPQFTTTT